MSRNLISQTLISHVFSWELVGERCFKQLAVLLQEGEEDFCFWFLFFLFSFFLCCAAFRRQLQIFILLESTKLGSIELLMGLFLNPFMPVNTKQNLSYRAGRIRRQSRKNGKKEKANSVPTPPSCRWAPQIQIPAWPEMKLIAQREECGNNGP